MVEAISWQQSDSLGMMEFLERIAKGWWTQMIDNDYLLNKSFEELETIFWKNIEKLDKLKKGSKRFKELYDKNNRILERIHELNQN